MKKIILILVVLTLAGTCCGLLIFDVFPSKSEQMSMDSLSINNLDKTIPNEAKEMIGQNSLLIRTAENQIYYKNIIYEFDYFVITDDTTINGIMYLGCLGRPLRSLTSQRQAAIMWTTDMQHLAKRIQHTGIYEEEDWVWIHPPRDDVFRILEYTPWPAIRFPVSQNTHWEREPLALGIYWADTAHGIGADDSIRCHYENKGITSCKLKFCPKEIKCWEITAHSTNLKNNTSCKALFSPEFGFVKMLFNNVDSSLMTFELSQIHDWAYFIKEFKPFDNNNGIKKSDKNNETIVQ